MAGHGGAGLRLGKDSRSGAIWLGAAGYGDARQGEGSVAVLGRFRRGGGMAGSGMVGRGSRVRRGEFGSGKVWHGKPGVQGKAWMGLVSFGWARRGTAWIRGRVRLGRVRPGDDWQGEDFQARRDVAWRGDVGSG